MTDRQKVAVIGAGWAGCAAAVELTAGGASVSLFESRTTPGGRARRMEAEGKTLDNGQHILLGAYTESLRLMKKVGINPKTAFLRLPLQMCYPPGTDGMTFVAPSLPAPFHLLFALLKAEGLEMADRLALARFISAARWSGWQLNADCAVTTLLERFSQTARLYRLLWKPLCISALNTQPEQASAQIFLHILRDSIGAGRAASDMLVPKLDFSALFPDRAVEFVREKGGFAVLGKTVRSLHESLFGWQVDGEDFDAVVMATSASAASTLLSRQMDMAHFDALEFEPIHTCYLGYARETRLSRAFFALEEDTNAGNWGQFVFDRGWLDDTHAGVMAVVISASSSTSALTRQDLESDVAKQLAAAFRMPQLATPLWCQTVSERHATFVCYPALARPEMKSGRPGLVFAGDYVRAEYPGTLESAVKSGVRAAACVLKKDWGSES